MRVDKVYICHWDKLVDRKKWLIDHLSNRGISDYKWVEEYDKDNWNIDQIKSEYPLIFDVSGRGRLLKMSEISLLLKHCLIVKDAYENGYESILVMEDDVVLEPSFTERLNAYTSQLPQDWDSCWVGSCCDLHATYIDGVNIYKMDGSRCTHAFLLSKSCISKIVNDMKFANDPADWYYNQLILKHNLNNYWFEPPLAYQNSKYETTIQ